MNEDQIIVLIIILCGILSLMVIPRWNKKIDIQLKEAEKWVEGEEDNAGD